MDLQEVMTKRTFAVVGDTLNPQKYAYKIRNGLQEHGYTAYAVGKELPSLNDVPGKLEIIDLCINPAKGLKLIQACEKDFDCIVIQPGAESDELFRYLDERKLPYLEGCLLVGLSLYAE